VDGDLTAADALGNIDHANSAMGASSAWPSQTYVEANCWSSPASVPPAEEIAANKTR
jgi:hypothetical protein